MTKTQYKDDEALYAPLAGYGVEIQFFDETDSPETQVTLPLVHFFNQNAALGSSLALGRWLK